MATPIPWERWRVYKAAIEDCLREGFSPQGVWSSKGSSVGEAQRRLSAQYPDWSITDSTISKWVIVQRGRKERGQEHLEPDWTLWAGPAFEISSFKENAKGEVTSTTLRPEKGPPLEIPDGMTLSKLTVQQGPDGRVERSWPRLSPSTVDPKEMAADIRAGLLDLRGTAPYIAVPKTGNEDLIACFFIADPHLGQLNWREQVGSNYDLKIAEEQMLHAYDEALERAPPADTALIAILGDYAHSDDDSAATPASKHQLDCDGRHRKISRVATRCLKYKIDRAREKHKHVIFEYVAGNHDPRSAGWLSDALAIYFENDPRVDVGTSDEPHRFIEFGLTMIGMTHGDKCPPKKFHEIACSQYSEMWGRTKFRWGHTGHFHREAVIELAGMRIKTHQAITSADKYAKGNFPQAGRSIDVETYSRHTGKYIELSVPILDHVGAS